jgi:hypothetical protein
LHFFDRKTIGRWRSRKVVCIKDNKLIYTKEKFHFFYGPSNTELPLTTWRPREGGAPCSQRPQGGPLEENVLGIGQHMYKKSRQAWQFCENEAKKTAFEEFPLVIDRANGSLTRGAANDKTNF